MKNKEEYKQIKEELEEEYNKAVNGVKRTMVELVKGVLDGEGEIEYLYMVRDLMKTHHNTVDAYVDKSIKKLELKLKKEE